MIKLDDSNRSEDLEACVRSFPFKYSSGGYFRERGVPKNVKAEIVHGDDALRAAFTHAVNIIGRRHKNKK